MKAFPGLAVAAAALAYLRKFVDDARSERRVRAAVRRPGLRGAADK